MLEMLAAFGLIILFLSVVCLVADYETGIVRLAKEVNEEFDRQEREGKI